MSPSQLATYGVLLGWVVPGVASAQPPADEPPAEDPRNEPPVVEAPRPPVGAEARLKALEERIRALEEQARAADERAAEAQRKLEELRAAGATERSAAETAQVEIRPGEDDATGPTASFDGYVEANYSYNLNRPSNGITDFRGFDNRHDSFTLSNAVLGATFGYESLIGRLAFQVGHTPSTYYLGEPLSPGGSAAATTDGDVFKYIQEAYVGYNAPVGNGLQLRAGIFLSPVGYEGIAVKDNFNWSRSNLFFGLPFYHTGLQAGYDVSGEVSAMVMLSNGVTGVVDNNYWKSVTTQWIFKPVPDVLTLSLLYFGGPERPRGAPENVPGVEPWRHLFDAWAQIDVTKWLTFAAQGDAGFERNAFGTSWWAAGSAYARVQPLDWLYLAARGDVFREHAAEDDVGNTASRLFWPADLVGETTFTVDVRPHPNLSVRAEYRHDEADRDMFFAGAVAGDGLATPYAHNTPRQDTLTLGATGWF